MTDVAAIRAVKLADAQATESERDRAWSDEQQRALRDIQTFLGAVVSDAKPPMFRDACELLADPDDTDRTFLVDGLLPMRGVCGIAGEPKTTKTWISGEIGLAVATGGVAFGVHRARVGRVAYLTFEDRTLDRRIASLAASYDVALEPGTFSIQPRGEFLDITRDADLARLVASCRMLGPLALLIIDPFRDVHSADEDSSTAMRDVMRRLRLVSDLLDATVVIVHHTSKATETTARRRHGQRLRGSSVIHAALDSLVHVAEVPGGNGRSVFCSRLTVETKSGLAAGAIDVELTIEDDESGAVVLAEYRAIGSSPVAPKSSDDAAQVLAWIVALAGKGISCTRRKLRDQTADRPLSEKRTEAAIKALIGRGALVLDSAGNVVQNVVQAADRPHHSLHQSAREEIPSDSVGARGATRRMHQRAPVGQPP